MIGLSRGSILGAYHVALFPGWQSIVAEQAALLHKTGLLSNTSRLLVGVVGDEGADLSFLNEALGRSAVIRRLGNFDRYEFPTLQWLSDAVQGNDCPCWYIHTKGVSTLCDGAANHRRQMQNVVVDNHLSCLELLNDYDACGAYWRTDGFGEFRPHFSGNFWWANSRYLQTLPAPESLNLGNRYDAEFWIGMNSAVRPFELLTPEDPFVKPSAWIGLEQKYPSLIRQIGPIRRIVDLGIDYGYTAFRFARDFPSAKVLGCDTFCLHSDAEAWVRSHVHLFPNLKIEKADPVLLGRRNKTTFDLLHIDGYVEYDAIANAFDAWIPMLRAGGAVLFHDIEAFPAVRQFYDGLPGVKNLISDCCGLGCWIRA